MIGYDIMRVRRAARICEGLAVGCRSADADVYEALGFEVFREHPEGRAFAWRYRGVGALLVKPACWRGMLRLTTDVRDAKRLLGENWLVRSWFVQRRPDGKFDAGVDAARATAATEPLAFCAAALRAFAAAGGAL